MVAVHRNYNNERDTSNERRQRHVVAALLPEVTDEAECQDADQGNHVDGDRHKLLGETGVAHLPDKGRDEVLDGL